jgi:thymidine kinase
MALLRFFHGTMGSGKSTLALQIHHNLRRRGLHGVLLTQHDRAGGVVSSRLGVVADAVEVVPGDDVEKLVLDRFPLAYAVCDEAQFYDPDQVDQLARLVDLHGLDVWAFGLLTSFQGRLFPGTARLLELADERQEIQVEARCWCGERATHNARLVDGAMVLEGDLLVVGDTSDPSDRQERLDLATPQVTYELLCRRHWMARDPGPDGGVPAGG